MHARTRTHRHTHTHAHARTHAHAHTNTHAYTHTHTQKRNDANTPQRRNATTHKRRNAMTQKRTNAMTHKRNGTHTRPRMRDFLTHGHFGLRLPYALLTPTLRPNTHGLPGPPAELCSACSLVSKETDGCPSIRTRYRVWVTPPRMRDSFVIGILGAIATEMAVVTARPRPQANHLRFFLRTGLTPSYANLFFMERF